MAIARYSNVLELSLYQLPNEMTCIDLQKYCKWVNHPNQIVHFHEELVLGVQTKLLINLF